MTVLITLTAAGADLGPFDLYSDIDGYTTPFTLGITRTQLLAGYTSTVVPVGTTYIKIKSTGSCTNELNINVITTTTTTTAAPTTTTTTTAIVPLNSRTEITYQGGVGNWWINYATATNYNEWIRLQGMIATDNGDGTYTTVLCHLQSAAIMWSLTNGGVTQGPVPSGIDLVFTGIPC